MSPETNATPGMSLWQKALPGLTLLIMAPLIAELLPGATRLSSAFVFPLEVLVWGTGALFARFWVRRFRLGWRNLVLLAVALSLAEELIIQQTSYAPLVIQIKGVEYARAFGLNYVYFVWAVLYEALFVVCIPVALVEMLFPSRRDGAWLGPRSAAVLTVLFVPAAYAAWYGWNLVARPMAFHLPPFHASQAQIVVGLAAIATVLLLAAGPFAKVLARPDKPLAPPHPVVLAVVSIVYVALIFAIEVLAFGAAPQIPPAVPVAIGLVLALAGLWFVPRWQVSPAFGKWHRISLAYAACWANFAVMFVAFVDAAPVDLYGKSILDAVAVLLMIGLAARYLNRPEARLP